VERGRQGRVDLGHVSALSHHWDLPQTLQDKFGGWQSVETAKAFADYAGSATEQLGLIYVDFDTLQRMPKLSAEWFARRRGRKPWCERVVGEGSAISRTMP
jgi:beta-glucosidase/6-phospho-beta-glucosidase/beta-galactosidase